MLPKLPATCNCPETCAERHLDAQRLVEMKAMNAERTRGERDRKERRRQEKEAARLQQQCAIYPVLHNNQQD